MQIGHQVRGGSLIYIYICAAMKGVAFQGRSQDFSKVGAESQTGTPSGDRRLYMVYTAALPRVSAGSVVLSWHEGPY